MQIVIDMDMPKNCRECPLRQRSEKYIGENYCMGMLGKPIKSDIFTKRADFCPIKCDIEDIKQEILDKDLLKYERVGNIVDIRKTRDYILGVIDEHTKGE